MPNNADLSGKDNHTQMQGINILTILAESQSDYQMGYKVISAAAPEVFISRMRSMYKDYDYSIVFCSLAAYDCFAAHKI